MADVQDRWLLLADLHFGKSTIGDFADTLAWIDMEMDKCRPRHIFILGDSLHTRTTVEVEILQRMDAFVRNVQCKPHAPDLHILVGNHDMSDRYNRSVNSVSVFHNEALRTRVYSEITAVDIDGHRCVFIPYHEDQTAIRDYLRTGAADDRVVFCHAALDGVRINGMSNATNALCAGSNLAVSDFKACKQVFSGHFHHHGRWRNVVYVGSPMMFTFGDVGSPNRGCIIYDPQRNKWSLRVNPHAEKYIQIDVGKEGEDVEDAKEDDGGKTIPDVAGKYVRIAVPSRCESDEKAVAELEANLLKRGAKRVDKKWMVGPTPVLDQPAERVSQCDIQNLVTEYLDRLDDATDDRKTQTYRDFIGRLIEDLDPWRSQTRFDADIESVSVENFLGVRGKRTWKYNLLERGLWFILGKNGAGKSTLSDAITFALFDITSRDVSVTETINNHASVCTVTVRFANGIRVTRVRRKNGQMLTVTLADGSVIQKATVKQTEAELHRRMNVSWSIFQRIAILNNNNMFQMFSAKDKSQTEVIENLIGLQIINRLTQVVAERHAAAAADVRDARAEHQCRVKEWETAEECRDNLDAALAQLHHRIQVLRGAEATIAAEIERESDRVDRERETRKRELHESRELLRTRTEEQETDLAGIQSAADEATDRLSTLSLSSIASEYAAARCEQARYQQEIADRDARREAEHQERKHSRDRVRALAKSEAELVQLTATEAKRVEEDSRRCTEAQKAISHALSDCAHLETIETAAIQSSIDTATAASESVRCGELESLKKAAETEFSLQQRRIKITARRMETERKRDALRKERERRRATEYGNVVIGKVICESRDFALSYNSDPALAAGIKRTVEVPLVRYLEKTGAEEPEEDFLEESGDSGEEKDASEGLELESDKYLESRLQDLSTSMLAAMNSLNAYRDSIAYMRVEKENIVSSFRAKRDSLLREQQKLNRDLAIVERADRLTQLRTELVLCQAQLQAARVVSDKKGDRMGDEGEGSRSGEGARIEERVAELSAAHEEWQMRMSETRNVITGLRREHTEKQKRYRDERDRISRKIQALIASIAELDRGQKVQALKIDLVRCQTQLSETVATERTTRAESQLKGENARRCRDAIVRSQQILDTVKRGLGVTEFWKDGLTPKGRFRKFCVGRYISLINKLLAHNIGCINDSAGTCGTAGGSAGDLRCSIDDSLRLTTSGGKGSVSFSQRSSGERKKTQLALLFTIMDFMMVNSPFKNQTVFVDEIYDSLDEDGRRVVEHWIDDFSRRNASARVFIVTHLPVAQVGRGVGIIQVERDATVATSYRNGRVRDFQSNGEAICGK